MENFVTFVIFILGLITVALSIVVSVKFNKYEKCLEGSARKLSKAVSWQLIGEAVLGFGTLLFSTAAFFGVLESWSIGVQSSIRLVMFGASSFTTIHLYKTLKSFGRE